MIAAVLAPLLSDVFRGLGQAPSQGATGGAVDWPRPPAASAPLPMSRNSTGSRADEGPVATIRHEALVMLLRNRPALAAELLTESLGVELPRWHDAQLGAAEVTDLQPAPYRADVDDDRARLYYDLVVASLGEAASRALEAMMKSGQYEYQSDFARRYLAKGRAEGKAEGEAKGKAEAVLTVLRARGLRLTDAVEQRIQACTDLAQLDEWLRRAVTVDSADELLG